MSYTADEIENAQDRAFEAPIPGMGLTTELGSRPWEQPPQYNTVVEALDFYLEGLFSKEGMDTLVSAVEMDASAIDIAEKMTMRGASEGLHSVDVGVLVSSILVEAIKTAIGFTDLTIRTGDEDDENRVTDAMSSVIQKRVSDKAEAGEIDLPFDLEDFSMSEDELNEFEMEEDVMVAEEQQTEMPSVGLMSRRV